MLKFKKYKNINYIFLQLLKIHKYKIHNQSILEKDKKIIISSFEYA